MRKIQILFSSLILLLFLAGSAIAVAPPAPTGLSPCGGATNVSLTPTLTWNRVAAASYYWVYLDGSTYFSSGTSYTPAVALEPVTSYSWSVEACNTDDECSARSPMCSFTTRSAGGGGGGGGMILTCRPADCPPDVTCIQNPLCVENFEQLLDVIINFIFWMGIVIAPVMLIIAGFLFVTSVGDPDRVQSAKKMMLYTIIGLVLVIIAKSLIIVLQSILGVTT